MYEVYVAEVLSRSQEEAITRALERRRVAIQRVAVAAAPVPARVARIVRHARPVALCVGCPT
ncbi:hypothetical protein GH740_00970 [Microbacterium sp. SYP-A9085]|uniref:hypothetical protein n=1 Tax=Microbacterium sp. SYP-A9085 TaxID=2664454 RepID=UPI00129A9490|nr:hypothetical protein [Microbacterium sp. SYP-A9085]MRH27889.1 hypothetical protein [Microbacterium sp. SYP-A9085]